MAQRPEAPGNIRLEINVPTPDEILVTIGFPVLYVNGEPINILEIEDGDERNHVVKLTATRKPEEKESFISGVNPDGKIYVALVSETSDEGIVVKRSANPEEVVAIAKSLEINRFHKANVYSLIQNYAGMMWGTIKYKSH